jgi:hypothetical protein
VAPSTSVKVRVVTQPQDVPFPTRTRVVWHKRRWRCQAPGCRQGSFTEVIPQLPPRARVTARLKTVAGQAVVVGGRTIAQAERDHDLSWVVVAAAFSAQATALPPPESEPVTMLGIDETSPAEAQLCRRLTDPDLDRLAGQGCVQATSFPTRWRC